MASSVDRNAHELLAFYRDAGVDALLAEEPIDRFADDLPAAPPPERAKSGGETARTENGGRLTNAQDAPSGNRFQRPDAARDASMRVAVAPPSPEAAEMSARAAAKSAESLEALRALLETFEGCMLRTTATQLVFADGNPKGRVMFVGEAPGRDEDIAGVPFVGRSGKLLDLMMQAIGLDRTQAYIANIVPWRPPGNRTPTPHESATCLPFLLRQIELADPDILVCLGQPSTQTLLNTKEGITRTRGRWFKFETGRREIRALATYHPAFLLRSPLQKRLAWRDFLALKKALAG
jgi:uracil-DNA glycosylase family 4